MSRINENIFHHLTSSLNTERNSPTSNLSPTKNTLILSMSKQSDLLNKIGTQNTKSSVENESKEIFWVRKGADGKQISENLLRENFNFDDDDLESYKKIYGDLLVFDENQCLVDKKAEKACSFATPQQIQKWQTSADGQKVYVALPPATVKLLRDFKQERIIDKSLAAISDINLRQTVKKDLLEVLNSSSQKRVTAAENLINLETESLNDAEVIRNTIRLAARQPENQNNPFIHLLSAKTELNDAVANKQKSFNFYVNSTGDEKNVWYRNAQKKFLEYEKQLQKSIDASAGIDVLNGRRLPNAEINRAESSWINLQLAEIYQQLDEPEKSKEREMIGRFYTVDDIEKSSIEFRMGTPRIGMDGTVFRGGWFPKSRVPVMKASNTDIPQLPKNSQEQPPKKELGESPFKFEYKTEDLRNRQGKIVRDESKKKIKVLQPYFQVEGSLKTADEMQGKTFEYKDEKGRIVPEGRLYKLRNERKTSIEPPILNRAGTTKAFVTAGGVGAIEVFNNNFPIVADYFTEHTLIERLKKEKTEKTTFLQNNYPIPPEPKDLPRVKLRIESEVGKEKAVLIMKKIEEMSYAVWGNQ